jgi:hypothetical protein
LLHRHSSASANPRQQWNYQSAEADWADTWIDLNLPGGPGRRELWEIVCKRKIGASASETIKKDFTTLNSDIGDHTSAYRANALCWAGIAFFADSNVKDRISGDAMRRLRIRKMNNALSQMLSSLIGR